MRNPEWTRDELILGLDAYSRLGTAELTDSHPDVIALSRLLNDLPIHPVTRLADLAVVCANCHRMLHRSRTWLSIADLRRIVDGRGRRTTIDTGEGT